MHTHISVSSPCFMLLKSFSFLIEIVNWIVFWHVGIIIKTSNCINIVKDNIWLSPSISLDKFKSISIDLSSKPVSRIWPIPNCAIRAGENLSMWFLVDNVSFPIFAEISWKTSFLKKLTFIGSCFNYLIISKSCFFIVARLLQSSSKTCWARGLNLHQEEERSGCRSK